MRTTRLILACVAVFVFVFGFEWVFHGMIMKESYVNTASLWRPEAEMTARFGWLLGGQLLLSVMFCVIYALRVDLDSAWHKALVMGFSSRCCSHQPAW
jgi:hypothetical protein